MKLQELFEDIQKKLANLKIKGKTVLLKGEIRPTWPGDFSVPDGVTSLIGSPRSVEGYYVCGRLNPIKTLEGCPEYIGGSFDCAQLQLTSLEQGPKEINTRNASGFGYECFINKLSSLKGIPKNIMRLNASENLINTLEDFPERIEKDCIINNNKLTNLKNIHKHIKHIGGRLVIAENPIKSHILGLLKIEGLQDVSAFREFHTPKELMHSPLVIAVAIINKHLKDRDILACQQELIDAGLEEFAQL